MERALTLALAGAALLGATTASGQGDPRRGLEVYRSCVFCHSLEPELNLTGPSLAGLMDRPAGTAEGFDRYSEPFRDADFDWEAGTLDAFLADPRLMFPATYMTFPGIGDADARADLIAFLMAATQPGAAEKLVEAGFLPADVMRGQDPEPLGDAPPEARVRAIRHCPDTYHITTEDGVQKPIWEKNVRLKIDSAETGPPPGVPAMIASGTGGDRVSVVFASREDLRRFLDAEC